VRPFTALQAGAQRAGDRIQEAVRKAGEGAEPRFGTPEQFTALLRADWEKQRGVLQRIGFKPE